MNGTGPFILEKYTQGQGATFTKNPDYWDPKRQPNPDRTELRFYKNEQARVLALQSGEVDALVQFSVSGGRALLTDPNIETISAHASAHRQVHMRTDKEPFTDKRVRQAMALVVDRKGLVDGLFKGQAQLGDDSPFAPVFKYTDTTVEQRQQDIEQAKQLLADAGKSDGFEVQLDTLDPFEIPDLAQLIQNSAKEAGITIKLNITDAVDLLRRRRVRQVAVAGLDDGHHRLRPPRRGQRVPRRAAAEQRHLEQRALQEQGLRRAREGLHRRNRTSTRRRPRRARSRRCCSTRPRSSSRTSTTSSRGSGRGGRASRPRRWRSSSSPAPARPPEATHKLPARRSVEMVMNRILVFATALAVAVGIPTASAVGHGDHGSHRAKVLRAKLKPVQADVAAYTNMRGRAQMAANRRNAKVSLHLKGMVPGATYTWAVVQGTDPATVCADGTPVTGFKYKRLKAGKKGNANSKGSSKKGAFTFDKTATYAVVVYQAGTTDEVLLCGVLNGKSKKAHKPNKGSAKKPK